MSKYISIASAYTVLALFILGCQNEKSRSNVSNQKVNGSGDLANSSNIQNLTTVPDWVTNAEDLKMLSNIIHSSAGAKWSIRPPRGYVQSPLNVSPGTPLAGSKFISPMRDDGSTHNMLVMIGKRKPTEKPLNIATFPPRYFQSRERTVGPIRLLPLSYGKINGNLFGYVEWSATHPDTKIKTSGFLYVGVFGLLEIMIDAQDLESHYRESKKLCDASAKTFLFSQE